MTTESPTQNVPPLGSGGRFTDAQIVEATVSYLESVIESHPEQGDKVVYADWKPEVLRESGVCTYSDPQGAPSCSIGGLLHTLVPEFFNQVHAKEWAHGEEVSPDTSGFAALIGEGSYSSYSSDLRLEPEVIAPYRAMFTAHQVNSLVQLQAYNDSGENAGTLIKAIKAYLS